LNAPSVGLFTYSTLPRGSVVHTANLADALYDAGWNVSVYALDKDRRGFFRPLRARLHLVPAAPAPRTTAELVRQRAEELADYLARHDAAHDIFHAEDCLTANGLLRLSARGRPMRIVRTVHHVETFDDLYLAQCQERSIKDVSLCFTVSGAADRDVRRFFGVRSLRVANGVSIHRFSRPDLRRVRTWKARLDVEPGPVILAVGGIENRKNTVRTLRAFALLRETHPHAQFWILGGATVLDHGVYREAFERELQSLPAETRAAVVELGVVDDGDVPALFRLASVLVFVSLHEGFGLAALEGLAAGLPVVASNRPPMTEFLDPSCAVLVDPLSEQAIADGIARALSDSERLSAAGFRAAERYSLPRVAALHAAHYRRFLDQAPRAGGAEVEAPRGARVARHA
jgi:glycosyltransferase-like protein